jgi:hypothetical protein
VPQHLFAGVVSDTTFDFELRSTAGTILVVSDGSGAAGDLADDLLLIGFEVAEETAGETQSDTWTAYQLVVWSSGGNTSPVSSAAYRRGLIDYVAGGGRLLIEGGELAYDAASSPGYPDFADSVLHTDAWNGDDVGQLNLDTGHATHPVATSPNTLPGTIGVTYTGWGSEDAAHPAGGAYVIYGTASHPTDAGVLVFDGDALPNHGQVVFFAFAYSDVSDATVARHLLENTAAYLIDDAALVGDPDIAGFQPRLAGAFPNPFRAGTEIGYFLPVKQHVHLAIYDVRGRLVRTLVSGVKESGLYHAAWQGNDSVEDAVSPGVYFSRLVTPGLTQTSKIVKIR